MLSWLRGPRGRAAAWIVSFALLWAAIGYAAGIYPLWVVAVSVAITLAGGVVPFAILDTIRLIRKRGSK